MDLALNNLQRLIYHKTNQPTNQPYELYPWIAIILRDVLLDDVVVSKVD